jgi:hypothetical protein
MGGQPKRAGRCPDATEFQIIQIVCWLLLGCGFVGKALALSTNPQAGALKEGSLLRSLLGTR